MRNRWTSTLFIAAALCAAGLPIRAADQREWQAVDAVIKEVKDLEAEIRLHRAAVEASHEAAALKENAEIGKLRAAVEAAEKELAGVAPELSGARDKMQAARAARDQAVVDLLKDAPVFQVALLKQAAMKEQIAKLESKLVAQKVNGTVVLEALKEDDLLALARLRLEEQQLGKQIYGAQRAWWKRGEVEPAFKAADEAYKAYNAQAAKNEAFQKANEKLKVAKKALADAVSALPLTDAGKALTEKQVALENKLAEAKARAGELERSLVGEGKTVSTTIKVEDRKTKQKIDKKITLWLPTKHDQIRGIVVAHSMISGLANSQPMRLAAARAGLGTMVFDGFTNDGKESLARLDEMFEKFAAEAERPELRGAPVVLGGLSASVLGTRNVACAVPERVIAVVHAAGGNMQEMPDDGRGMIQVPFIALNGEFEWCGPIGGIQPAYGNQTQWVMIREQMLRLWREKYEHRMTLVVVPNADHGAWDQPLTALFVRKAVRYRAPLKHDGSKPAVCRPLPLNTGWLTDADLDHPTHEPAPYDQYKGDKANAFWHFDEEMARAVYDYHKDKFLLPDPTKKSPIPQSWPSKK